ncbi:mannitol-1-phosphate 5-dehydrogenase [Paenarthrobacter sp. DKR-5]|uniref:mannitol-1-phosphate 5-dehydrogenase n=1 Tax=Paenarthrobacter sp. DKR-5 TaxID=2835535 RepID=UPI001BDCE38E|nr:mannitol-1-phosphate 5-dehydrogenase [Paenarthrobacter sp. DKR-5]MBT1001261.1 mannitol-1-phosphate 5-dehydrogenase [Paenarthrobacter sp. DKR-5]
MRAVHFGAGNIGRGFVGLLLHQGGFHVVFADVAEALIDQLRAADSYQVHTVGEDSATLTVDDFSALNSGTAEDDVVQEIAGADVVTTAVGPNILRFVAPVIARGLAARADGAAPLQVMACENAINATDLLAEEIRKAYPADAPALEGRAVFANTAVDRIVPNQEPGQGLDVTVETFFEWAVERGPFKGAEPDIPGVTWVEDLAPYIERKLFTVNTGHATSAYFGFAAGHEKISDALADPAVAAKVRAVLEETKALLVAKHGFAEAEQEAYVQKILTRFANPYLPDTVVRVGRAPLRKLSRHERFIGPAAELAERGTTPSALLAAIGAALRFRVPEDQESVQLEEILRTEEPLEAVRRITGLEPDHPLFPGVLAEVEALAVKG